MQYQIYCLVPAERPGFADRETNVLYVAEKDDGLFRSAIDDSLAPPGMFTRFDQPWQHLPNPLLFLLNAACKLAAHPTRPLPKGVRDDMVLCLQIVFRIFTMPAISLPSTAEKADILKVAREHLQLTIDTRTPAK